MTELDVPMDLASPWILEAKEWTLGNLGSARGSWLGINRVSQFASQLLKQNMNEDCGLPYFPPLPLPCWFTKV
jgi:hypothetical protein